MLRGGTWQRSVSRLRCGRSLMFLAHLMTIPHQRLHINQHFAKDKSHPIPGTATILSPRWHRALDMRWDRQGNLIRCERPL